MSTLAFSRTIYAIALSTSDLATLPEAVRQAETAFKKVNATYKGLVMRRNKLAEIIANDLFALPAEEVPAARQAHAQQAALEKADASLKRVGEAVDAAWNEVINFYEIKHFGGNESYPYLSLRQEPVQTEVVTEVIGKAQPVAVATDTQLFFAAFGASQAARRSGIVHDAEVLLLLARSHRRSGQGAYPSRAA